MFRETLPLGPGTNPTPVPLITSNRLLDAALLVNERSRELARGKRESANYFLLRTNALRNDEIMNKIKRHVESFFPE